MLLWETEDVFTVMFVFEGCQMGFRGNLGIRVIARNFRKLKRKIEGEISIMTFAVELMCVIFIDKY